MGSGPRLDPRNRRRRQKVPRRGGLGLAKLTLEKVTLGFRPLPKDGYPLIGFPEGAPGIYLAVMHSGVTLSPIVGKLAALEILDGVEVELLSSYRHSRFDSKRSS
jgi:glycine/D-amino acid oxidase-like deaminating enzyme